MKRWNLKPNMSSGKKSNHQSTSQSFYAGKSNTSANSNYDISEKLKLLKSSQKMKQNRFKGESHQTMPDIKNENNYDSMSSSAYTGTPQKINYQKKTSLLRSDHSGSPVSSMDPEAKIVQRHPPLPRSVKRKPAKSWQINHEAQAVPSKGATIEKNWTLIASYLSSDHDWERQQQACNYVKEFSISNPEYFRHHDEHQGEVITSLLKATNSLRT